MIPGLGIYPGEGKSYLLQYSGLENSMGFHDVAKRHDRVTFIHLSLSPLLFTSLLSSAICKASSDKHLTFLLLFFFGMDLLAASVQYYGPLSCDFDIFAY